MLTTLLLPPARLSAQTTMPTCSIPLSDYQQWTLPNNWKVSTGNPGGSWFGTKIRVLANATIYFDQDVSMAGCIVRMEAGSKIVVEDGKTLSANGTIFFGCGGLWDAIEVGYNCGFNLSGTEIRDATRGLVPRFGNKSSYFGQANTCRIQNCIFNNNLVGITLDFTGQGSSSNANGALFVPATFSGNKFTTSSGTLVLPDCGMKITFCAFAALPTANIYEKMGVGIRIANSLVGIKGATFAELTVGAGTGIIATSNSGVSVEHTTFNHVIKMVDATNSRYLAVQNCTLINGIDAGVSTSGNGLNSPQIIITYNDMTFQKVPISAINVERSPTAALTTMKNWIDHNTLHINGNHQQSCSFINITAPSGGADKFPITWNNIFNDGQLTTSFPCNGIYIKDNASGYDISHNFLNYSWTAKPNNSCPNLGISLVNVNGQRNIVTLNNVTSSLFSNPAGADGEGASWMKCSYHLAASRNLQVCLNTTNNTYRAFHFAGDLDYCDFAKNSINNHLYGWHCAQAVQTPPLTLTNMGNQLWHENTWNGTCLKASAQHRDFPNGNPPFIIGVYSGNQNPPGPISPGDWVLVGAPIPPEEENSACINAGVAVNPGGLADWDKKVVDGTYPYVSASQAWDMQRDLLYKLIEHPEYRPAGSPAQAWYNGLTSSSAWQYANIEWRYYQAYQSTAAAQTSLYNAEKQFTYALREAIRLDSLQNLDVTTDDATLRQQQLTAASQLSTAKADLDNRQGQARTTTLTALVSAQNAWNTLPATSVWESNRKVLYGYWLTKAQGTALIESDYVRIRGIANQCPQEGGMAVREIPFFLPTPEANAYSREDYWVDCVGEVKPRQGRPISQPLNNNALTIFPNPANEQISLFLTQAVEATWILTDLTGRTWQHGRMAADQNSVTFHTQNLPEGLYLCTVRTQSGLVLSTKVIIQH